MSSIELSLSLRGFRHPVGVLISVRRQHPRTSAHLRKGDCEDGEVPLPVSVSAGSGPI